MHVVRVPMIGALVAELARVAPSGSTIDVAAFDLEVASLVGATPTSAAGTLASLVEKALEQRFALGLTNIASCAAHMIATARANAASGVVDRFVVVSDGIATFGDTAAQSLAQLVSRGLPPSASLSAVTIGDKRDDALLATLVGGRGRVVAMPPTTLRGAALGESVQTTVAELRRPVGAALLLDVDGARWTEPERFYDVAPGDELVFFVARNRTTSTLRPRLRRIERDGALTIVEQARMANGVADNDVHRVAAFELLVGASVVVATSTLSKTRTHDAREQRARRIMR